MVTQRKRVMVAMSGGVDSSVSAALLQEQGYEVVGVSLQLYDPAPREPGCKAKTCCSLDDVLDAGRVAKKLGIDFSVIDMRAEFKALVIDYFVAEYAAGRTPNPCIRCNDAIKFDLLLRKAREMGADLLATGHYARIGMDAGGVRRLMTGCDPAKDQTYFLYSLDQEQLQHLVFPVGGLEKTEVRRLAREFSLPVAQKHESQEICFIPDNDYIGFLERNRIVLPSGPVVTEDGKVIGRHAGLHRYTVGQRKGLGIAWPRPLYVVAIRHDENVLVVGERESLSATTLIASGARWSSPVPQERFRASCRIRYRHASSSCMVEVLDDNRFRVEFDTPQFAVTPGQAAVIYDGECVLGGGWIE